MPQFVKKRVNVICNKFVNNAIINRCMKTIERAHSPKNLWEKVELPANKEQAIGVIEKNLQYWPEFLITKNKERFLRIQQYLRRMRKLRLKVKYFMFSRNHQ